MDNQYLYMTDSRFETGHDQQLTDILAPTNVHQSSNACNIPTWPVSLTSSTFDHVTSSKITQQHQVVNGPPKPPRRRKPAISEDKWERIRGTFTNIYQQPEVTLRDAMEIMSDQYGFHATIPMYKKRITEWKIFKNIHKEEKEKFAQEAAESLANGQLLRENDTEGRPIPWDRVCRYDKMAKRRTNIWELLPEAKTIKPLIRKRKSSNQVSTILDIHLPWERTTGRSTDRIKLLYDPKPPDETYNVQLLLSHIDALLDCVYFQSSTSSQQPHLSNRIILMRDGGLMNNNHRTKTEVGMLVERLAKAMDTYLLSNTFPNVLEHISMITDYRFAGESQDISSIVCWSLSLAASRSLGESHPLTIVFSIFKRFKLYSWIPAVWTKILEKLQVEKSSFEHVARSKLWRCLKDDGYLYSAEKLILDSIEQQGSVLRLLYCSLMLELGCLARSYAKRGDFVSAKNALLRSIEMQEDFLRAYPSHLDTMAILYSNLAMVHDELADLNEAEANFRKALQFWDGRQVPGGMEGIILPSFANFLMKRQMVEKLEELTRQEPCVIQLIEKRTYPLAWNWDDFNILHSATDMFKRFYTII